MFASIRGKKKATRDGAAAAAAAGGAAAVGGGGGRSDQLAKQQKPTQSLSLQLPEPLRYYPGTQMPMDGWFHACRLCRCWTAFSATATTGEHVPLCRRCLPAAARKGLSTGRGATRSTEQQQQQQQQVASAATVPAGPAPSAAAVRSRLPATYAAAGVKPAADAVPANRAAAAADHQVQHDRQPPPLSQQTQDAVWHFIRQQQQQQQQHKVQHDIGSIAHAHSAPPGNAAAQHSRPTAFDQQQAASLSTAASAAAGALPAACYAVSCYKHLGPTSHAVAPMPAPADHHYITCMDEPASAAAAAAAAASGLGMAASGGGMQPHTRTSSSAGSDGDGVLASITALLSDLYSSLSFSSSGAAAGSGAGAGGSSSKGAVAGACGGALAAVQQHGMTLTAAQGGGLGAGDDGANLPI